LSYRRQTKSRANRPSAERACERCGRPTRRPRELERHLVCFVCFRWILAETARRLAAAGRGNGLPLIELG
jgi:hypothetical protein